MINKIKKFIKQVYLKIFRINDTPIRIALGFGLGVFAGLMPGTGPIAALVLAFLFRVNRASALLASVLSNTWVSLIAFLLAIKIGSVVLGLNYQDVYAGWSALVKNFKWEKLFEASVLDILIPLAVGYFIIALIFAGVAMIVVYAIALQIKKKNKK